MPDTVCVNAPVNIVNTTTNATSYFWNFCVAGINSTPTSLNLGNPGGTLSSPVFSDIVSDNGNFYVFVVDFNPGGITRLDFGNNLLNTPTATYLGNPSGAMNANYGNEGIQVIKNEGKWYAIIVGGNTPGNGSIPRIVKIEFGTNIANNSPTGTNWGNLGNLFEPIDLHMFNDNGIWYGFTVNAESNTITRFNFTNSFNNTPTAVNLGNIGGLHYPTGIYAIDDNGFWRVFVGNGQPPYSLTRLDFGSSLLNIPTGVNLNNPNNVLNSPRDFTILKLCDEIAGFAVNGNSNDLVKFDFHNDLSSTPTGTSLGNTGNLNFPHSLSKFFRVGNDIYTLITNVSNNTITRLQFSGCNIASTSSSTLKTPPTISYNQPGTYNINLSIDDGLPTQNSFCKKIVVIPLPAHTPPQTFKTCVLDSIKIGTGLKNLSYEWSTGATTDSIYVKSSGAYWVKSTNRAGCSNTDSFRVDIEKIAVRTANNDTSICAGTSFQLHGLGNAVSYSWSPATGLSDASVANPVALPLVDTRYILTGTGAAGCIAKDTVFVTVNTTPVITRTKDTSICHDQSLQLNVSGGSSYSWQPNNGLSSTSIANPVATPVGASTYYVSVSNGICSRKDSIKLNVIPTPVFSVDGASQACKGSPVTLLAKGGDVYSWQPADGLDNAASSSPKASPATTTNYSVKIIASTCKDSALLNKTLTVFPLPIVTASRSNDINCNTPVSQLNASGGLTYSWQPASLVDDSTASKTFTSTSTSAAFVVKGTDNNGCSNYDSIKVLVTKTGDLLVNIGNAFSPNDDGKNDCFGISRYAGLLKNVEFSVYDRFGLRVFYTKNAANCWDGRYKGRPQDAGGFVYILKASTFCGEIFKKGIVMLLR